MLTKLHKFKKYVFIMIAMMCMTASSELLSRGGGGFHGGGRGGFHGGGYHGGGRGYGHHGGGYYGRGGYYGGYGMPYWGYGAGLLTGATLGAAATGASYYDDNYSGDDTTEYTDSNN